MPKIEEYPALTTPDDDDLLVCNSAASETTKKITRGDFLGGSPISTDTISEKTSGAGVAVDGLTIKDGALATANSCPIAMISNPYKFRVSKSSNQTGITSSTYTTVDYDQESYDTNNNFNLTTNQYTVPVTGYYHLDALVKVEGTNVSVIGAQILGGAAGTTVITKNINMQSAGADASKMLSDTKYLAKDELLSVQVYGTVSGGTVTVIGSATEGYFAGYLVSV